MFFISRLISCSPEQGLLKLKGTCLESTADHVAVDSLTASKASVLKISLVHLSLHTLPSKDLQCMFALMKENTQTVPKHLMTRLLCCTAGRFGLRDQESK